MRRGKEAAFALHARRVGEAEGSVVLVIHSRFVVPDVAVEGQPRRRPVRCPECSSKPVAVVLHLFLLQIVQRVDHVAREGRLLDRRVVFAFERAAGEDRIELDVRLEEAQAEEDACVCALVRRRAAVERSQAEVNVVGEGVIDVHPEILPAKPVEL